MTQLSTLFLRFSYITLIFLTVVSCKNEDLIQRGDSLQTAFEKAMGLFEEEDYGNASEAFETVIQLGRGTDYAEEAQFYLAESYYNQDRYLLAASEYERYVSLYPRSDHSQESQYKEAVSYYHLSPRYKLDQQYTRRAIEKFQLFNSRFPDSELTDEVSEYVNELRSKLAKKNYYAGDLYLRIDNYDAAIIYYDLTIDQYPESPWAQRSLVDKIKAYVEYADRSIPGKQEERYQKAVDAYETFVQLFPEGEYRSEAEDFVDEARSALASGTTESAEENAPDTTGIGSD